MARIEIIPAEASHLEHIAAVLRQADRDEVTALTGRDVLSVVTESFERSSVCMVALVDGRPEVIFGAGDLSVLTRLGAPWLLGSDAIKKHRSVFLRLSRHWLEQLFERYSTLRNIVDCRNDVAIRWLRWLGFEFSAPFEHRGHRVMMFELRS